MALTNLILKNDQLLLSVTELADDIIRASVHENSASSSHWTEKALHCGAERTSVLMI